MHDAVIIGGGHNGLTARPIWRWPGSRSSCWSGAQWSAAPRSRKNSIPGFRNSVASYTVSLLNPKVIADLRLAEHGLRIVERRIANFLPLDDGRYLKVGGGRTTRGGREVLPARCRAARRLSGAGSRRSPTCCARSCWRRRRTSSRAIRSRRSPNSSSPAASPTGCAGSASTCSASCSICSPIRPATISTAGSRARRSRRPMASTASSAITRAPIRRARPTCCCITASAR